MKDAMAWLMTSIFLFAGTAYFFYLPYGIWSVRRDFSHRESGYWWRRALDWKKIAICTTVAAACLAVGILALVSLV